MSIVPLGLNRVSVPLQLNRSYNSLGSSQSLLAKYEQQIMTERQYTYGSDSPFNATATLAIQTQMERKAQNSSNLKATQNYLSATDSTLAQFNALTDDARSMALEAINTTTSDSQRQTLAQTTKQALQQMFDFANYSYQGRYVFAGSTTSVMPFAWGENSYTIDYRGTEQNVYSWSDTDLLSQSNMNGVDVFGAISQPVRGQTDLNPSVSADTLLSDLNGGKGIEKGSIRLTYMVDNRTMDYDVDLSDCVTLGDVERKIENLGSPYFTLGVDLTENGIVLSLPPETPGVLTVSEVGKQTLARQLGIPTGVAITKDQPLIGRDLNPALTSSTSLGGILGSRANTTLRFAGQNNDIFLQAKHNGETYTDSEGQTWPLNGIGVSIRAETDILPGGEYVDYDPETQQLLIHIHPDNTSANDIIRAINEASEAGTIPPLEASASGTDQQRKDLAGTGIVSFLPGESVYLGETAGGKGVDLDLSGLQITNGNTVHEISFEDCKTIGDVLTRLNDPQYGLYATINEAKNGIDIRSRVSGADFCIGENGGNTAAQFGVRTTDLDTRLDEFDYGRGVNDYDGPGTQATAKYSSVTANSNLILRARNEGSEWNGYQLNFVPTTDPQGQVVVSMDEDAKTIAIGINPGVTTACQIVEAFNTQPGPKQFFDLEIDTSGGTNTGEGVVYDGFATTSGGADGGIDFTITRNDGTVLEIDIHGAKTMGDVLRIINEHPDNKDGLLVASLSKSGNGIELTDKSFGDQMTRVDRTLLSTAAIELGLVDSGQEYKTKTETGTQASASIDFGVENSSLLITAKSVGTYANGVSVQFVEGTPPSFTWDAASQSMIFSFEPGTTTANDLVQLFQSQASDTVRAMFDVQNGTNADGLPSDGSGSVSVAQSAMAGGSDSVLKGNDPNPKETESLFNALIRLQVGMEKNDVREIERATQLLDAAVEKMTSARATIGVMQNSLDNVQIRLEDEYVQHEEVLNYTLRIDYAEASLSYMGQLLSYQSSMQITSSLFQLSLLNYL